MKNYTALEIKFEFGGAGQSIFPVVLHGKEKNILVDCCYPGFYDLLKASMKEHDIELEKIYGVIITHHDFDHVGLLSELKKRNPEIVVMSHKLEKPYIEGDRKSLRLEQAERIFSELPEAEKAAAVGFQKILESFEKVEKVKVDRILEDKEILNLNSDIEIVHTSGHTPGHISLYIRDEKTFIAGDTLAIENGVLGIANPEYTLDMQNALNSVRKMLDYDIEKIVCYHGGIFEGDVKDALKRILK